MDTRRTFVRPAQATTKAVDARVRLAFAVTASAALAISFSLFLGGIILGGLL